MRSRCERTGWSALYFFFQAEDGIRDYKVTGVQTCALPILEKRREQRAGRARLFAGDGAEPESPALRGSRLDHGGEQADRSEERRVGKECRSRGAPYHLKKKKRDYW